MRNSFKIYGTIALLIIICTALIKVDDVRASRVISSGSAGVSSEWDDIISSNVNARHIKVVVDGIETTVDDSAVIMSENRTIMVAYDSLRDLFSCAANLYQQSKLILEKYNDRSTMVLTDDFIVMNESVVDIGAQMKWIDKRLYIPLAVVEKALSYDCSWDVNSNVISFSNKRAGEKIIPYAYDYRVEGKMPVIKNQSTFGTCWAFAALMAMETAMAPDNKVDFSEDHMSINNHFNLSQNDGGEYTMAMAYLSSWTGPVWEVDDPYGDGYSPEGLEAVVHVQEMQVLERKNFDSIKKAVFLDGGVQSSIYMELKDANGNSSFYNKEKSAYCYIGTEKPNHDIVIIGWDDNYPASSFNSELDGDGAFICANSWGEEFGEQGVFYVSYYDSNIGVHNIVYTGIESTDNYDNIYQSDLCGWIGQIGYNREYAYFANVYTAKSNEKLKAVSFYATGIDTEYEIYWVDDFKDESSFADKKLLASGQLSNVGYYTIDIDKAISLNAGEDYAVVVYVNTPNADRPVAIEYAGGAATDTAIIDDGRGYISLHGNIWQDTQMVQDCNVCLKIFTDNE